jgi:hypothetical protein
MTDIGLIMFDYCNSNDFEKAVDYNDIRYYRIEDDIFNAKKGMLVHLFFGLLGTVSSETLSYIVPDALRS